jgi:hypothetical protein
MRMDVSEERITSNFMVENEPRKTACNRWLGRIYSSETSVHIRATRRYIPEDVSILMYRCENIEFC